RDRGRASAAARDSPGTCLSATGVLLRTPRGTPSRCRTLAARRAAGHRNTVATPRHLRMQALRRAGRTRGQYPRAWPSSPLEGRQEARDHHAIDCTQEGCDAVTYAVLSADRMVPPRAAATQGASPADGLVLEAPSV